MVKMYRIYRWRNGFREYFQYLNLGSNFNRVIFTRSVVLGFLFSSDGECRSLIDFLHYVDPDCGELLVDKYSVDDYF